MCRVEDVHKSYGKTEVLRGVSFSMDAAERVGLMGPSGSGKSTLLNCLSGIDRPDSGQVSIAGLDLSHASTRDIAALRRTDVSTVFQFFHLLPTLTAYENIQLSLQLAGVKPAERGERVKELLEAVQLEHRAAALPETLSGGEQQRVAIARALAHRPKVILADEPTGNLDSHAGMNILNLLDELAARYRIAMLIVTHSEEVTRICGRVLHMRDGQLV
ncbi:MAG: ABC transporter ATP-binding protein [Kiritimatiellales bacterium]|nr:ABC transporter ATP-binding protein [Kiritimatiellales bacterium]